jgi:RES domain-containing protein
MILYRLTKKAYADDLSGTGARLYGGRWNNKGRSTIYLASSQALALLEILVHLPPLIEPKNYLLLKIEVPGNSIMVVNNDDLPYDWNSDQPPISLKKVGDDFLISNQYLLLKVPSAVVPGEYNYLLNIQHAEMKHVKIISKDLINFDKRLLRS